MVSASPASASASSSSAGSPSTGAASPSASASASAPASPSPTPNATPAPTPTPTPKPTPRPTPAGLLCGNLLRNIEVRQATGLSDATLLHNANAKPDEAGQTRCVYVAQSGQVTITAAVWTNSSLVTFFNWWDQVATYSQAETGIGTRAIVDAGDGIGLAQVRKMGISIQIKGPSGVPAGVDALTACEALLKLLAKRV